MSKFLRNLALFSIPFWLGLIYLFAGPYDKEYGYNMITKDCRTGNWIYRRLYESPHPVDVAFIGTSKTMCDVNDALVQERLAEQGIQAEVANFGICRKGENLHYLIARELFAQKPPQVLFVEVSSDLATSSHFHFPYLAEPADVLFPPQVLSKSYLSDLGDYTWTRFIYQREHQLGIQRTFNDYLKDPRHSFLVVANDMVGDPAAMEQTRLRRSLNMEWETPSGFSGFWYDWQTLAPKAYYKRIHQLCQEAGTELYFLFLPIYGSPARQPWEQGFFKEMAPVLLPPDSVFKSSRLHMDDSHLNQVGAKALADWLTEQVGNALGAKPPGSDRVDP